MESTVKCSPFMCSLSRIQLTRGVIPQWASLNENGLISLYTSRGRVPATLPLGRALIVNLPNPQQFMKLHNHLQSKL